MLPDAEGYLLARLDLDPLDVPGLRPMLAARFLLLKDAHLIPHLVAYANLTIKLREPFQM